MPWTLAFVQKYTWQRNQEPEYDKIRQRTQGGRGRGTEETEGPVTVEPPGADRDLGICQGQQGGDKRTQEMVAKSWAAEAGG